MAEQPYVFWGAGAGGGKAFDFTALLQLPAQQSESVPALATQEQPDNTLAHTLVDIRRLGGQLDTAVKAERIARESFNLLRSQWNTSNPANMNEREQLRNEIDDLKLEVEQLKGKIHEDANLIDDWHAKHAQKEDEIENLKASLKERDSDIKAAKKEHDENIEAYDLHNKQLEQQLAQSQASASKQEKKAAEHAKELDFYKARSDNFDNAIKDAHAAIEHEQKQCEAVKREKAEVERQRDILSAQHEEVQAKLAETYTFSEELEELNAATQNLQADQERQTELQRELERTIIVKDERIAQLEQQFQKERQRALHAEQVRNDAHEAAATSPIHDAVPLFSDAGNSLQSQLDEADYDEGGPEYFDEEPQALSEITAISSPPVEPVRPKSTVQVCDVVDLSPFYPASPRLTSHVHGGESVAPQEVVAPKLAISIDEGKSVDPIDVPRAMLDRSVFRGESTSPKEPKHNFAINVDQGKSVEPVDVPHPMLDTFVSHGESTPPMEPKQNLTARILHDSTLDIAPEAPAQPEAPKLRSAIIESASIDIAPTPPSTNLNITSTMTTIHDQSPSSTPTATEYSPIDTQALTPSTPRATTISTGVQTVESPTEPLTAQAAKLQIVERIVKQDPKPNKLGWPLILLSVVAMLIAGYCAYLFREVNDWRTANGVAYRGSYNGGAYGNGRYLFGFIPLAMDEDDFFAKLVSNWFMNHEKPVSYY